VANAINFMSVGDTLSGKCHAYDAFLR